MKGFMISSCVMAMVVMMASTVFAGDEGRLPLQDARDSVITELATQIASGKNVIWETKSGRQKKVSSGYPLRTGNTYIKEVSVRFDGVSMKVATKRGKNGFWSMED